MLSSLLPAITGLTGVFLGYLGSLHIQRRNTRAELQRRIATTAGEALAAAGELQTALETYRLQWSTWRTTWPTIAIAATDLIAADRAWIKAAPTAFRTADRFRRDRDEAARTTLTAPIARLTTALVAVSFLEYRELRISADALREAVAGLLPLANKTAVRERQLDALNVRIRDFRGSVDRVLDEPRELHSGRWHLFRRGTRRTHQPALQQGDTPQRLDRS
jgi:hypothetical protein